IAVKERSLRAVTLQQPDGAFRVHIKTVLPRQVELGPQAPLPPEFSPVVAPAVLLRRRADIVVAMPAEARPGVAMRRSEHSAQCGEVAFRLQLEILKDDECLVAIHAVRDHLGYAQPCLPERLQAV